MYDGYSDNSNDSGCGIKVEFKNQVNIFNVKFYDNNCEDGVINVRDTLTLNIGQAEINSNSADYGLVVINNDVTNTHINELDIYDNTINLDSIMLIRSPNVDINHLDMYDNFAVGIMNIPNDGGTSSQTLLDIRLQNSSFVRNEATKNIVVIDSFLRHSGESGGMDVNIDNVTIADNSTSFFPPLMLSSSGQYTPTKGIDGVISNLTIANNNRSGDVGMDISAAMIFISFGSSPSGVALQNILLANNLDEGTPRNCSDIFDPPMFWPASTGNNLSDDDTCNNVFNHVNDLNDIDAGLNPLEEDNGTWVLPLQVNSPTIDGGVTVSGMTTDQRGMARPQNNAFDIGAYETVLGVDTSNSNQSGGNSEQGNNASNNSDSNMGNISGNLGETGTTILSTSLLLSVAMSTIVASKRLIKNTRAHYKR